MKWFRKLTKLIFYYASTSYEERLRHKAYEKQKAYYHYMRDESTQYMIEKRKRLFN